MSRQPPTTPQHQQQPSQSAQTPNSPHRPPFYRNSSSSTSQLQNSTSRTSVGAGNTAGFFDRHNIFARNRPRTSGGVAVAGPNSEIAQFANSSQTNFDSPHAQGTGTPVAAARRPTSSRSASHNSLLYGSPERHRITDGRFGFPSPSPSSPLRSPRDENHPAGEDPSTSPSAHSSGRRFFGMAGMSRTHSSGGTSISGGIGPASATPSAGLGVSNDRSGSAFGRMFRRYSHGQGRANSNATDPNAVPNGASASHLASVSSFANGRQATTPRADSQGQLLSAQQQSHLASSASSTGQGASGGASSPAGSDAAGAETAAVAPAGTNPSVQAGMHRIRLVPHLEATRSLHFEPIERDVREGAVAVKIGRFTDRTTAPAATSASSNANGGSEGAQAAGTAAGVTDTATSTGPMPGNRGGAIATSAGGGGRVDSTRIAFKSKVVSRGHAEVWCEASGKFFIRDTKSSSGTFLNHIRLSAPNVESRPFPIKDGDILQLGVDYQGGTEEIYRCVKIRVELNRGWQREANQFNVNALRQLRALQGSPLGPTTATTGTPSSSTEGAQGAVASSALPTNRQSMNVTDCCICLFSVTVCQALFIAPCSHVFHYKCIRPLLNRHHPGFSCPLCRTFADLEADVEQDEAWQEALLREAEALDTSRSVPAAGSSDSNLVARRDGSSQGHGSAAGGVGGTAVHPTPSHEISGMDLRNDSTTANGSTSNAASASLTAPHAAGPVASLHANPAVSSPLRQQVVRNAAAASAAGGGGAAYRPTTADRPGTAVGDGPPPTAQFFDVDQTMTAIGAGGAVEGSSSADGHSGDVAMEEAEEVMDEDGARLGGSHGHGIDRISEELERSESSMDLSQSRDGSNGDMGGRRSSQPISIRGRNTSATSNRLGQDREPVRGASGFSPLEESRTPVNQHVLSVLAEAPPPHPMAARRFAEHQASRRPSAVPSEYGTPGEGNSLSGHGDDDTSGHSGRRRSGAQAQTHLFPGPQHLSNPFANRSLEADAGAGRSSSTFTSASGDDHLRDGFDEGSASGGLDRADGATASPLAGTQKGKHRREESMTNLPPSHPQQQRRSASRPRAPSNSSSVVDSHGDSASGGAGSKVKMFFKRATQGGNDSGAFADSNNSER